MKRLILAAALMVAVSSAAVASTGWVIVPSPSVGTGAELHGVTAVTSTDVWTVGFHFPGPGPAQTLVEHWNGEAWSVVASPTGYFGGELTSVSSDSANDVWAAGHTYYNGHTLIEHWDGTAWTIVPSPDAPGAIASFLNGIVALSPTDVWAAGFSIAGGDQPLIEHWDGNAWTIVPNPEIPGGAGGYLRAITALRINGRSAVLAVGNTEEADFTWHTLAIATDGRISKVVPTPNVSSSSYDVLQAAVAISPADIWVAGAYFGAVSGGLFEHWNGRAWSIVPPAPGGGLVSGLAAASADDVWAVGAVGNPYGGLSTSSQHWDGTRWSLVPTPNQGSGYDFDELNAVAVPPGGGPWAVGLTFFRNSGGPQVPLIEHHP